jgi:hypothetical protein
MRYPLYLEQVECTHQKLAGLFDAMKAAGVFGRSIIIVHGDHGSRLALAPPDVRYEKEFSHSDYVDSFSTLFAVKEPRSASGYDERLMPIDRLLAGISRDGDLAEPTAEPDAPLVYFNGGPGGITAREMPDF